MNTALILISLNTFLYFGALVLLSYGYHTSKWAVYNYNCVCGSDCIFFIGLFKAKYTKASCDYTVETVDCNDFGLNNDNCDLYESARDAASLALALVVVLLVWKIVVNVIAFKGLEERKNILWILFLLATIGDIIVGFAAFISAGQFDSIDDWNVIKGNGKPVHFDEGDGWQSFIGGGVVAWAVAILGAITLWLGFGTKAAEPTAPPLPVEGNTK